MQVLKYPMLFVCLGIAAIAQTASHVPLVTQPVDSGQTVTLPHHVHPLARPEFDQGTAPGTLPMQRIQIVLNRSAQTEAALSQFLEDQQNTASPNYHHWLTPAEFGAQFGAAQSDITAVTNWLQSEGFTVDNISNGRTVIEFSGTAAVVQRAFGTEIHSYAVNGHQYWANSADPKIPAALAPAIGGVLSLYNFPIHTQVHAVGKAPATLNSAGVKPQVNLGGSAHALSPGDYAVIYNSKPLVNSGVNGSGYKIAVLGRSNLNTQDIADFRRVFGLPAIPLQVIVNGTNPGDLGGDEELEAVLDTSWAGAVAPDATVEFVVSASTNNTDGTFLSEEYAIDNNLADVISDSFGSCEADYSQSTANYLSSLAQQAAAQGMTFTVASGDSGSAGCDSASETSATGPLSVNILAATPYTVAVGGTQLNENGNSSYWSSQSGSNFVSANSYIPEDVWGTSGGNLYASGGGRSTFFIKPSWQTGVTGIPSDGARDIPDVSLSAAVSDDPYALCIDGGCAASKGSYISVELVGGTSATAPSFASIMALIDQKMGARQGNANSALYRIAASENWNSCNASNTSSLPSGSCVFNDITSGTNAVPGEASYGTSSETYIAGVGYDLATGLGSVNVYNLANAWSGGSTTTIVSGYYAIINSLSGRCLADSGVSLRNGSQMILWDFDNGWEQEWQLISVGSGYYEILNRLSGKVLDDTGYSTNGGTIMQQWQWFGNLNQQWQIVSLGNGNYKIVNRYSGLVLDVGGAGTSAGTFIIQWPWWGGANQQWQLRAAQ